MMGRAVRVLFALGVALAITLFLCTDESTVTQETPAPREPNTDSAAAISRFLWKCEIQGGGRTKLNGEPHEIDASHLLRETLKNRQGNDIMGHFVSSTLKRLFSTSHSRQRRSSQLSKLFIATLGRNKPNPLREVSSPAPAPTSSTPAPTPTTTTQEPTVVTVTEVMVTGFENRSFAKDKTRVFISIITQEDAEKSPSVSEDRQPSSSSNRSSAASFSLLSTCAMALSRLFSD